MQDKMLRVREVAERLHVGATCVYQLIEKRKLACHRIGVGRGAIRVSESDLNSYLERCRNPGTETNHRQTRPPVRLKHLKQ